MSAAILKRACRIEKVNADRDTVALWQHIANAAGEGNLLCEGSIRKLGPLVVQGPPHATGCVQNVGQDTTEAPRAMGRLMGPA